MSVTVKDKDFVVVRDRWKIDVVQAIKVTAQTVFYIDKSWTKPRERRLRLQDCLFSGEESVAKRLCQQLQSSYQLKIDEQQKASVRQQQRDAKFIEAAAIPPAHRGDGAQ